MQVTVDNVWCSTTTLHMRVTVWGPGERWRHRYDSSVPLDDIPEEAVMMLQGYTRGGATVHDLAQQRLF